MKRVAIRKVKKNQNIKELDFSFKFCGSYFRSFKQLFTRTIHKWIFADYHTIIFAKAYEKANITKQTKYHPR